MKSEVETAIAIARMAGSGKISDITTHVTGASVIA